MLYSQCVKPGIIAITGMYRDRSVYSLSPTWQRSVTLRICSSCRVTWEAEVNIPKITGVHITIIHIIREKRMRRRQVVNKGISCFVYHKGLISFKCYRSVLETIRLVNCQLNKIVIIVITRCCILRNRYRNSYGIIIVMWGIVAIIVQIWDNEIIIHIRDDINILGFSPVYYISPWGTRVGFNLISRASDTVPISVLPS